MKTSAFPHRLVFAFILISVLLALLWVITQNPKLESIITLVTQVTALVAVSQGRN